MKRLFSVALALMWIGCANNNSEISVDLPGGATMEFVWIEPGTFLMGSPSYEADRSEGDEPRHQVSIGKGFYFGKYEITQGQWQAVTGASPWSGKEYVQVSTSNPAVYVSWEDMQDFVLTLNQAAGDSLYRLPT